MGRGGARQNAGTKPTWKNGKTKTIRVPIVLADEILRIARKLDEMGTIEFETSSNNVLNLSGISTRPYNGLTIVCLEDLVRNGYQIKPEGLHKAIREKLQKLEIKG